MVKKKKKIVIKKTEKEIEKEIQQRAILEAPEEAIQEKVLESIKVKVRPVVLIIFDGWGKAIRKSNGNAIKAANPQVFNRLLKEYSRGELAAHGGNVGLPMHQDGNSEAGHMNIGAGRIVKQDTLYISEAIEDGTFYKNTAFLEVLKHAKKYNTKVHILGLLSNGESAHSAPDHLHALLDLVHNEGMKKVFLHLFTDGRDSPPFSAPRLIDILEENLYPEQKIVSIIGRFYAMDRNKYWSRTELTYNMLVNGEGVIAPGAHEAVLRAYNRGESDEFIIPTLITDDHEPLGAIDDNDVIIFFNLRSDRARQLTKPFVQPDFETTNHGTFKRKKIPQNIRFCALTDFGPDLPHVFTAFPSRDVKNSLTEVLKSYRQLYIAESEKYAHITYFFNGGYAEARFGEKRVRVPSPRIAGYNRTPRMSANKITNKVVAEIKKNSYDFIAINFANADMVAHTGDLPATVKAVNFLDECLDQIVKETLKKNGVALITGDHGNAEEMHNVHTGEVITEHSKNPAYLIIVGEKYKVKKRSQMLKRGKLGDVAPTILKIMGIKKPKEMTGNALI